MKKDLNNDSLNNESNIYNDKKSFNKRIEVNDLIYIGLFTVLISLVTMLCSFIGFVPQLIPFIPTLIGLVCGPIYMLFATKISKPGMFFIVWFLQGAFYGVMGHGLWTFGSYAIGGLIGELILFIKKYKSINFARFAFSLASISVIGQMLPMFINKEEFIRKTVSQGYTVEYANKVISFLPNWSIAPILIGGIISTFIGCSFGILILKKHFVKIGMVKK